MNRYAIMPLIAVAIVLSACNARPIPTQVADEVAATSYQLGPGDEIEVYVFGEESMSGTRKLDGNGVMSMPLVGNIEARGLTPGELEAQLRTRLTKYLQDPKVSVEVLSYRPVYLVGEVRNPGSYPYVDGMTVINAVATAGGFTYRARENRFIIDRKSTGQTVAAEPQTPLQPGDVVTVPERYF